MSLSDSSVVKGLPTLAELQATRRVTPKSAMRSRLDEKVEKSKAEDKDEAAWKRALWHRDRGKCRWCARKVQKTLTLCPERGECHHIHGRTIRAIRWDKRAGLLVCQSCHERLTGTVKEKHVIIPSKTFTVDEVAYADADFPVEFKRLA